MRPASVQRSDGSRPTLCTSIALQCLSLEPVLRVFEGCARAYLGDVDDANVVKLHRFSGKISYLAVPKFDEIPHPPVRRTIKLSLRNLFLQCIDHTENKNPLLLDQKEKMIEADHPWRDRFARFTIQEAQHGLLEELEDMQLALGWHMRLKEAGLMIRGYRLLYRDGVARKRLPPKHLFTGEAETTKPDDKLSTTTDTEEIDVHDLPANDAIDSDVEDASDSDTDRPAELPARSRRFGVGKEIGYAVYVHRQYEDLLGATVEWAKRHLPEHYDYTVVKLNQRNDSVSFIHCPEFDIEHEPAIAAIIVVSADGTAQRRTTPSDPYIYHHKWLFVADDYEGFDVADSIARSQRWISLGSVDRSRIGRKSFWEEHVVPRLKQTSDFKGEELDTPDVSSQTESPLQLQCQNCMKSAGYAVLKPARNSSFLPATSLICAKLARSNPKRLGTPFFTKSLAMMSHERPSSAKSNRFVAPML